MSDADAMSFFAGGGRNAKRLRLSPRALRGRDDAQERKPLTLKSHPRFSRLRVLRFDEVLYRLVRQKSTRLGNRIYVASEIRETFIHAE